MKKMLIFMLALTLIMLCTIFCLPAQADGAFGRVQTNTNVYRSISGSNDISNVLCIAEKSYFVEIIDRNYDSFIRVKYNGISGYVKKTDVKEIIGSPSTPYPYNINLSIKSTCNLRSTPTTKSTLNNVICTLYPDTNDFTFIGRVFGDEAIDFGGNTWYYVMYNGSTGYIYNQYIKSITPIYENLEVTTFKDSTENMQTINPITHVPSIIIILILFIPCIALLTILFLKPKEKKPKKVRSPKIFDRY